jgi:N-glycosylase/DNA lyase
MNEAFIEELQKPIYNDKSDQQAADLINALTVRVACNVKIVDVLKYAVDQGIYGKVNADAFDPSLPRDQRIAIWNIKGWVDNPSNPSEVADMTSQTAATMIADLVQYGYATEVHAQELAAMGFKTIHWVDHVGIGTQSADSIRVARDVLNGAAAKRALYTQQNIDRYNSTQAMIDRYKNGDPELVINGN